MRGATKWSYWSACYINDVLTLLTAAPILYISLLAFRIVAPGFVFVWIQYAFAEPLFLYTLIYFTTIVTDGSVNWTSTVSISTILILSIIVQCATGFAKDP